MTEPRKVSDYGGPKANAVTLSDPTKYVSATEYGRLTDDCAQMTATTYKAWVHFPTALSLGPVTPSAGGSHMGTGSGNLPTVARTGTGVYTVTYPASWVDDSGILGQPGASESIAFIDSGGAVRGSTPGHVQTSESGNVITVYVFDPASSFAASDLGGGVTIRVEARG